MKMNKSQSGFTLIELVVVMVVLGILAAVALPKLQGMDVEAKKAVVQGGLGALQSSAVISYGINKAPTTLAAIKAQTILDSNITIVTTNCDASVANPTTVTGRYGADTATDMTAVIPAGLCVN